MDGIVVISPNEYRQMPWRNGLGITIELLSEPANCADVFNWRISMADVSSDGPFSVFDLCDRVLILVDGNGITLCYEGGGADELCDRFATAVFSGDSPTCARLHDGPIRDFNIIFARERYSASTKILGESHEYNVSVDGGTFILYAIDKSVVVRPPCGKEIHLNKGHLLRSVDSTPGEWRFSSGPLITVHLAKLDSNDARRPP